VGAGRGARTGPAVGRIAGPPPRPVRAPRYAGGMGARTHTGAPRADASLRSTRLTPTGQGRDGGDMRFTR
jgi:hypothetical protein